MPFEDLIEDLQKQERWLSECGVDASPPPGLTERVRHRVHLALDEGWLADSEDPLPPLDLKISLKSAVRAELARAPERKDAPPVTGSGSRLYRLFSSVAAVAAIAIAAGLGAWSGLTADRPVDSAGDRSMLLVEVLGRSADSAETELDALEADIADLETTLAGGYSSSAFPADALDELDEELDLLMEDLEDWPTARESAG